MTTLERREKCRQNRLEKWHFRPLGARQTRSRLLPAPLETLGPKPAKPLPINAVQSIERVGIGESKRKSQVNNHDADVVEIRERLDRVEKKIGIGK